MHPFITINNARLHNLKNVSLKIPKGKFIVLTGLSGSGKSTLAFDLLHMEGARQYMESLGLISYGLTKAPVDSIQGLSPTISINQHLTNRSPRSTVGTSTDLYSYLRVLYARLGHRPCPVCGKDVPPPYDDTPMELSDETSGRSSADESTIHCPHCGASLDEIGMEHFSFNKPEGACPTCTGLGVVHQANLKRVANEELSIIGGAVEGWNTQATKYYSETLKTAARRYGFAFDLDLPIKDYTPIQRDLLFFGTDSPEFRQHFPNIEPPTTVNQGKFEGIANILLRRYAEHVQDEDYIQKLADFVSTQTCPDCNGTRLRPESRAVTVMGYNIIEIAGRSIYGLMEWLEQLPAALKDDEMGVAASILTDFRERIRRVIEVGVGYLTLDQGAPTLSAGEAQRLRLASLLGSGLSDVLYIFDEPTIGLHARDTHRLVEVMRRLRDLGNTILVVEHDLDVIASADYVIDVGPGAGKHGGQIVAAGTPDEVAQMPDTLTGAFLDGRMTIPIPDQRRTPNGKTLTIRGAREHNLKNLTVDIPLGVFIAVTGVSGSGKSTLIFDILDPAGRRHFYGADERVGAHDSIEGWEHFDKIITINQAHIGRIPRSNAATYSDAFTPIRETFAATPDAKQRKMTARHFSFNVPGGRCERCEGAGTLTVKMHFLPDVEVTCPTCKGRRFKPETLAVKYRDHDIAQVLDMTIEEALALFADVPAAVSRLQVMVDVGLGYLQLGQPATTLSGGEAQRVKLAKELGRRTTGRTLYLLDEPTTGLHPADTARLLILLQRLVDAGNTVIVVEHNLDVIKTADWIIDIGHEGGAAGGYLIAQGTPEQIIAVPDSHTGAALKSILQPI